MTDNEIIKALECCMNGHCDDDCPFRKTREHCLNLDSLILNLINRQKAEIERLQSIADSFTDIGKLYSEIKAEAYKEFAEEVNKELFGEEYQLDKVHRRAVERILNRLTSKE